MTAACMPVVQMCFFRSDPSVCAQTWQLQGLACSSSSPQGLLSKIAQLKLVACMHGRSCWSEPDRLVSMPCHHGSKEELTNDRHNETCTECASCSRTADRILTAQVSKHMHLKLLPRVKQDLEKRCRLMAHTVQVVWPVGHLTPLTKLNE